MRVVGALLSWTIVVLLLRSTALSSLATRGVVFDVLAFATVAWALRHGAAWGATFGFVLGVAADLDAMHWLGRHALVLSVAGYAVGELARTLVRESARTQFMLIALAAAVHQAFVVPWELGGLPDLVASGAFLGQRVLVAGLVTGGVGVAVLLAARRLAGRPVFGRALGQSD